MGTGVRLALLMLTGLLADAYPPGVPPGSPPPGGGFETAPCPVCGRDCTPKSGRFYCERCNKYFGRARKNRA